MQVQKSFYKIGNSGGWVFYQISQVQYLINAYSFIGVKESMWIWAEFGLCLMQIGHNLSFKTWLKKINYLPPGETVTAAAEATEVP